MGGSPTAAQFLLYLYLASFRLYSVHYEYTKKNECVNKRANLLIITTTSAQTTSFEIYHHRLNQLICVPSRKKNFYRCECKNIATFDVANTYTDAFQRRFLCTKASKILSSEQKEERNIKTGKPSTPNLYGCLMYGRH